MGSTGRQTVDALGIAGSMASGIIEYLAEGAWTKRMHAGWAAQSGLRAAMMARSGFSGPRTVFEGTHGLFHGFAHTADGNYDALLGDFGARWVTETLAFKPYPCGTMTHPYIDCARRLAARGIKPEDIKRDRLRRRRGHRAPPVGAARRQADAGERLCGEILAALLHRDRLGARECRPRRLHRRSRKDARVLALAAKVGYRIDPQNPYPNEFTGHVRATLARRQRGRGAPAAFPRRRKEPLTRADIFDKFALNCRHGGWDEAKTKLALDVAQGRFMMVRIDLKGLRA